MTRNRYALLIGIDRYPLLAPENELHGAINDIEQLASLLEDRFRFPHRNIRMLRNEEATRAGILDALAALKGAAGPGDSVVVQFSGHGSQITDREGDEPDGLDETLVPFDGHRSNEPCQDITDDEIYLWVAALCAKEALVTLLFDSCHSGHALRDEGVRVRSVKPDPRSAELLPPSPISCRGRELLCSGGLRGRVPTADRCLLLAACRDDQAAYERLQRCQEEAPHGHWTFALLRALHQATTGATGRDIFERACTHLIAENLWQTPQIAGARDREIFGVKLRPPARFVRVKEADKDRVRLAAGAVQGLVRNSVWQVHPRGTLQPRDAKKLATVRVTSVGALTTLAEGVAEDAGKLAVQEGDRAFSLQAGYEEMCLRVAVEDDDGERESEWMRTRVAGSPVLRLLRPGEPADVTAIRVLPRARPLANSPLPWLGAIERPVWVLVDRQRHPIARPFEDSEAFVPGGVVERLERSAWYRHALRLKNAHSASKLAGKASLDLLHKDAKGRWQAARRDHSAIPDYREGEQMGLELTHQWHEPLYVYLLDFGLTERVELLYPEPGSDELLEPGELFRIGLQPCRELDVGLPDDFDRSTCGQRGHGIGFLKLFAATHPVELYGLLTNTPNPVFRAAENTGLSSLLAMHQPDLTLRSNALDREDEEDWTTVVCPYRLLFDQVY